MRAVILAQHERIWPKDLVILPPRGVFESVEETKEMPLTEEDASLEDKLEEIEKRAIKEALKKTKGHKTKAAEMLGMNRSTMYYRMKKYGIKIR
jgi:DNA-binding NtrC family response regulator